MSNSTAESDDFGALQLLIGIVATMFGWIVKHIMPENGKRIVFAGSLYAHFKGVEPRSITKDASEKLRQEINDTLNLVKDNTSALDVPVLTHGYIWKDADIDPICDDCERGVDYILRITPEWLVYDKEKMRKDAAKILHHFHKLVQTNDDGLNAGHA